MLQGAKINLIAKLNELFLFAKKGKEDFVDVLSNFLVTEYEFNAVVLFKVSNGNLIVLGKSENAKKNYAAGNSFNCSNCELIKKDVNSFYTSADCNLQISDFVVYESCSTFSYGNETGLIKIARKSPLTESERESLKKLTELISNFLVVWKDARGSDNLSADISFTKLVLETGNELRNPTNNIIGFTSILAEDNLTSSQSNYVYTIKKHAQKLLSTLNDLGEIAKIETSQITSDISTVNAADLIKEVISLFESKNEFGHIKYSFRSDKEISNQIVTDPKKLKSILNTILITISKLTVSGNIEIILRGSENSTNLLINAEGEITNYDKINKLLYPYTTAKIDELKESNLSGLALPLAKKYAELIGSNLIISTESSNNSINIKLPLNSIKKEKEKVNVEDISAKLPKPTDQNKVLVIEDDFATSRLLSNYLNKWGYDPVIVNTEEQTFSQIDKEKFLAVILDIELPNTNGLELLKKIREHKNAKNVPVIVCSVEVEEQKAYMMGAVEYFVKPINYNFLVEVLTSYKLRKDSKILCVDDDVPTLNLVKQAIETAGYKAVAEHVSANVLNLIKDKDIDLAIVDLDMPHPNGFELIKLIKSEQKFANLPIIIYTGKENYQEDLKKIEGLFEDLLDKKSVNIEDLSSTIKSMINRYETPAKVEEVIKKENVIKILLAEDYKHSQIIVTRLLKKNGFENIVVVENGEEALNTAKKERFDLILMDMQMPIMNGFEATEALREIEEYKETPIVALTAFAMKGDREKCLASGATDYIPKPIDSKEFIEKVKYYTNSFV